jgi:SAM-dependent methyltransferase
MAYDRQKRIQRYQQAYQEEYGFEAVLVAARQRLMLELIRHENPNVVVEIGCGTDLLSKRVEAEGLSLGRWIIVEPSETFAAIAEEAASLLTGLNVIRGFVEDRVQAVLSLCPSPPDLVICSGVLHEVPELPPVLRAVHRLLEAGGLLHVNVPNAYSLHRRLARAMGMIADERELSPRNVALSQFRVFDLAGLQSDLTAAGFRIEETGGYLIKPFTHKQMEVIRGILSPELLDGLWALGRELPEFASEIYANARVGA